MKKLIAFNFKMNLDYKDVKNYLSGIKGKINDNSYVFCPPTIFLPYFISEEYSLGVQNVSEYENGAHTGEVSCTQAKSLGCNYAIIGHSERRKEQDEDDILINQKVKKALEHGLKVILCIGETKEDRELLKTTRVLKREITDDLQGISTENLKNVIIAYEPIWAIGTGLIPTNKDIAETVNFIIDTTINVFNQKPKVLYGGSVNEKNIEDLNTIKELSGFLIGGASLDVNKVLKIKEIVEK